MYEMHLANPLPNWSYDNWQKEPLPKHLRWGGTVRSNLHRHPGMSPFDGPGLGMPQCITLTLK